MICELTDNGIKYDWWLTGPEGMRVILYPVKQKNSHQDIAEAKKQLRKDQDVVRFYIEWITAEQFERMKLYLHHIAKTNDKLNVELNAELLDGL